MVQGENGLLARIDVCLRREVKRGHGRYARVLKFAMDVGGAVIGAPGAAGDSVSLSANGKRFIAFFFLEHHAGEMADLLLDDLAVGQLFSLRGVGGLGI